MSRYFFSLICYCFCCLCHFRFLQKYTLGLNYLFSFTKTLSKKKYFNLRDFNFFLNDSREIKSFTEFYSLEIQLSTIKRDSLKSQITTFNKLKAFRPVIDFEDINYKLVEDFDRFLKNQNLGENTIAKHASNFQVYINKAIRKGFLEEKDNPYKLFKPKTITPQRLHLTADELRIIENQSFSEKNKHLELVRDAYLLCCYTGLRFGDMVKLCKQNIVKSKNGLELKFIANKTSKPLILPLRLLFKDDGKKKSKAEKLIQKYLKKRKRLYQGTKVFDRLPFFKLTNQYFNRSLKEIAQIAGIDKPISSHSARRTFATIMAKKVKGPVLQRMLQHSSMDMTNIYIQLINKDLEDELNKIKWS